MKNYNRMIESIIEQIAQKWFGKSFTDNKIWLTDNHVVKNSKNESNNSIKIVIDKEFVRKRFTFITYHRSFANHLLKIKFEENKRISNEKIIKIYQIDNEQRIVREHIANYQKVILANNICIRMRGPKR